MSLRPPHVILTLAIVAASTAAAQVPVSQTTVTSRRVAHAVRLTGSIKLDGHLDDPAWAEAPVATGFIQSYPKPNAPSVDATEVRILYDDAALYVGVRMFDSHADSIAAPLARRDASGLYSDELHVMIDSYHDRRTAFRFTVNPRGVKEDVLEYNDNNEDPNWDAVWDVVTSIDSLGWTAEYRIPFSQLRFGDAAENVPRVWGFEIMRDVARRNERDSWQPWDPQAGGFVSIFGDLDGIVGVPSTTHAELLPYVSNKLTRAPTDIGNPFFRSNATKPSAGADFKVGLPKGLTLTGAINPDFGQVEVDPAVVNLSAFETFFPEKRPFFIEGAGIFDFGHTRTFNNYDFQQYFYSRRIGRAPSRSIDAPFVDAPDATTIDGAAKLTGRVGPWTVGAIDAVTAREDADFRMRAAGPTEHAPVEPLSNYFVGRVRRDYREGQTQFGGILMATHRDLSDTGFTSLLRDRALVGGVDFEHGWDKGGWYLSGYAAGTSVSGAPSAIAATQQSSTHYFQRPDASYLSFDPTRTSLTGGAGEIAIQRSSNTLASLGFKTVSPGVELNDLGFQGRSDYQALSYLYGRQSYQANGWSQRYTWYAFGNQTWNYGGDAIFNAYAADANATFNNFWSANINGGYAAPVMDDRLTRGGPLARLPGDAHANGSLSSDSRRNVSVSASFGGDWDRVDGGRTLSPSVALTVRPASAMLVTFGPTLTSQIVANQYVQTVGDPTATATFGNRYVFGRLDQTTLSADTRVNWTFTTGLSLEVYAQPFVSAGHYTEFRQLARPSSGDYTVFGRDAGTVTQTAGGYVVDPDGAGPAASFQIANPDFNIRSLRGDAVLRWEYRPGSALYVVWQQQRSGEESFGDFAFHRDVGAIFREPVTNVFVVKLTYWVGI